MSEWDYKYLEEVGTLGRGKSKHRPRWAPHLYGGKYPFIQTGQITAAHKYIETIEQTYSEDGLKQSKLWGKDTLCITIAANIAEIGILSFPACFPDSVLGFQVDKEKADLDFIFYTMIQFQHRLKSMAIGSVQDNINLGTFKNIQFPFPSLEEQKEIGKTLGVLDKKITLLRQQNQDLEELAQTLFKRWFVEFEFPNENGESYKSSGGKMVESELGEIPDGWNLSNLGELAENKAKTYKYNGDDVVFINTGDVLEGKFLHKNYSNPTGLPGQAKKAIELNDILYSEIRPRNKRFAFVDFDSSEYVVSTKFMVIKTKGEIYPHILYLILKQQASVDKIDFIAESRSGTFPQVTFDSISDFEILKAPMNVQEKFMDILLPSMQKQKNNEQEIQTLTQLRDSLLPKLMSGELRVKA